MKMLKKHHNQYILDGKNPVAVTLEKWAIFMGDPENRIIKQNKIGGLSYINCFFRIRP